MEFKTEKIVNEHYNIPDNVIAADLEKYLKRVYGKLFEEHTVEFLNNIHSYRTAMIKEKIHNGEYKNYIDGETSTDIEVI